MIEVTAGERGELTPISRAEIRRRLAENDGTPRMAKRDPYLSRHALAMARRHGMAKFQRLAAEDKRRQQDRIAEQDGVAPEARGWYFATREKAALQAETRKRMIAICTPVVAVLALVLLSWADILGVGLLVAFAAALIGLVIAFVISIGLLPLLLVALLPVALLLAAFGHFAGMAVALIAFVMVLFIVALRSA